jgi:hypothetical protein
VNGSMTTSSTALVAVAASVGVVPANASSVKTGRRVNVPARNRSS